MPIDLHTHSSRSDGTATPDGLVAEAAAQGLDVVGLTDHDTVDGWQEAATAAVAHGITLVRGIESPPGTTGAACTCSRTCPTRRTSRSRPRWRACGAAASPGSR